MNQKSCPECKKEIPDGMKFCPHCLTPIESKTLASEYIKKKKPTAIIILAVTLLIIIIATIIGVMLHQNADELDATSSPEDYSSANSQISSPPSENEMSANNYSDSYVADIPNVSTQTQSSDIDKTNSESISSSDSGRKFDVDQAHFKYNITDYCVENSTEVFNLYDSTEIAFSESDGVTHISFNDSLSADIRISVSESSIKINCVMVDSNAQKHFEELAACLCMVLFDCVITPADLSQGMEFSKDGYNFTLHSLYGDNGMYLTSDYTLTIEL